MRNPSDSRSHSLLFTGVGRFVLLFATIAFGVGTGCRRRPDAADVVDRRNACERGLGRWTGDDVETRETDPAALALAREAVRVQHWRVTENTLESQEGARRAMREALHVVGDSPERCDVELTLGDRSRRLSYQVLGDGRLRIAATGGAVAMLLRRDP